jgi:hypothetical protein
MDGWNRRARWVALLAVICAPALALPVDVDVSAGTDGAGGRSFGSEVSLSPSRKVSLRAGAGYASSVDDAEDLAGVTLSAGATLRGERLAFALDYDRFDDRSSYQVGTLAARAAVTVGGFEIALLGRYRDTSVTLALALPNRTLTRDVDFAAVGGGLQLTWSNDSLSVYLSGITYDYDDDFDSFVALTNSPLLERRPRIEALVGTFITQTQGAIDRQLGAGVERNFGRNALALDVARVHDALLDSGSTSIALTFHRAQTARFDWSLSGGVADSERYGDIAFLTLGAGFSN